MKLERLLIAGDVKPAKLFLTVLGLIFGVEVTVMFVLPWVLPGDQGEIYYAFLDACLLTGVLAPLLWTLVIVPLRVLAATRLQLLDRILEAQEEERGHLARELHDSLGQLLTCLQVGLRAVEESTKDEALQHRLQDLRRVGSETHSEIRRLASGLRPPVLDDVGLVAALERHCEELNRTQTVRMSFLCDGPLTHRLPQAIETACYRIAQEATTNSMRHGHATEIAIELHLQPTSVQLVIRDNGQGFYPTAKMDQHGNQKHIGLWSIHERVELLAGTVTLKSAPGVGTTVVVSLPIPLQEVPHGQDSRADC